MNRIVNRFLILLIVAIGLMALIGSGGGSGDGGGTTPTTSDTGTISGKVFDANGDAIAGVTVRVTDDSDTEGFPVSTATAADGGFSADVPVTDRAIVNFSKTGYVFTCRITPVTKDETSYLPDACMIEVGTSGDFDTTVGATIDDGMGGTATVGADAFVDADGNPYSGTATASLTVFNPTREADLKAFPGDFEGVNEDGDTVPFKSYGFMDVTVRDGDGNLLQLDPPATASITIPIPASLLGSAPATMPLWYFDAEEGIWQQEGTLTRNGDVYEGTVEHLSIWNADHPYARGWVTGRVVDGDDEPVAGALVYIKGIAPNNNWLMAGVTDADGYFPINPTVANPGLPVEADSTCQIWVKKAGETNQPVLFAGPDAGETMDYGDIVWAEYTPVATVYSETVLGPWIGIDFSTGETGNHWEMPAADGAMEGPVWFHNLDDWDYSYIKDMGTVSLTDVTAWPGDWDPTDPITLITEGHSYVVKCKDGYAKFYVVSVDDETGVEMQYYFSTTSVFDK